jgi:hypothetical protein
MTRAYDIFLLSMLLALPNLMTEVRVVFHRRQKMERSVMDIAREIQAIAQLAQYKSNAKFCRSSALAFCALAYSQF